jgi:serine protease Do
MNARTPAGKSTPRPRSSALAPSLAVGALLLATGGWTCQELASRKPGDESVSIPLDSPPPGGVTASPGKIAMAPPAPGSSPTAGRPAVAPPPLAAPSPAGASPTGGSAGAVAVTPRVDSPNEARALSRAFSNVARALAPSVVRIDVEVSGGAGDDEDGDGQGDGEPHGGGNGDVLPPSLRRFFQFAPSAPVPQRGTGSGVVLDGAGNIVTNRHVVARATKVNVVFADGREFSASVVGTDRQTDVAVVRLQKVPEGLTAARLGDSDRLEVGEWVMAVGSPLGLDQTVTVGIISGKGRVGRHVQMSGERVRQYIQTDAKINPGNSGGPLVNLSAEVVGINTLINTGPGGAYGFAIPINQVRRVAEDLLKNGHVKYPYLGVMVGDVKDLEPGHRATLEKRAKLPGDGAIISGMTAGSPAAHAGLRAGDVITELDGKHVDGSGDVIDYVSSRTIGSKVSVGYVREGKRASLDVVLGELPESAARAELAQASASGLSLQTLTPALAQSLGLPRSQKGAIVVEVVPDSSAARASIAEGELLTKVDGVAITSADEAYAALARPRKGGHLIRLRGPRGARFVTLDPGAGR